MRDPFCLSEINKKLAVLRLSNLKEVQKAAIDRDPWMIEKAARWLERWGESSRLDEILNKIAWDIDFAKFFAKDPQKQSFHEKYGQKSMLDVGLNVRDLPSSGVKAIYIHNGKVLIGRKSKPDPRIKSIDCLCTHKGFKDFILQKWIAESGGAQDNQFSDIRGFVEQANMYASVVKDNTRVIALVDGPYFSEDKLRILRRNISEDNRDRVKVLSTFEYMKFQVGEYCV